MGKRMNVWAKEQRGNFEIEDESDFELTPEQEADFLRRIEEADREIEEIQAKSRKQRE